MRGMASSKNKRGKTLVATNQDIQLDENDSEGTSESKAKNTKPKKNWLFGTIIVLMILGMTGGGYFFYERISKEQKGLYGVLDKKDTRIIDLTKQVTNFQSQVANLQAQLVTIDKKLATQDSKFERTISEYTAQNEENLNNTKSDFDGAVQRIQRQLGKTRGDWLIADAEYLLSVANERLHLVADVKTSLLALEAADQRLRESGDPGAFKVRDALAKEINILKKSETPDIVGLSARLRALEDLVPNMPLLLPHAGKIDERINREDDQKQIPKTEGWDGILESAIHDVKALVTIKRTDSPVKAVLVEGQVTVIRESLRLKLEMARVAVIQRNEQLFWNNLDAALGWISKHFDTKANKTKVVATEIKALRGIALDIDFPNISKSLVLLRNITKLRIESDKAMGSRGKDKEL